jgi:biotin synthase
MDRYLLRFETSDPALYARLHPDSTLEERLASLRDLADLGVQVGSGFLVGVPGEDVGILADNILLCRAYALDMIGIGPFIAHPDTPLAMEKNAYAADPQMFYRAVAVLRLANPDAHIPATTAYDAVFPEGGRDRLLERGANVFMPSYTPRAYRKAYLLYPDKPCVDEEAGDCEACVRLRLAALGRPVGEDAGHALQKSRPVADTGDTGLPVR